jgi:hypothetical protein
VFASETAGGENSTKLRGITARGSLKTTSGTFHVEFPGGGRVGSKMLPFYSMGEVAPYKMYFDRKALPFRIW